MEAFFAGLFLLLFFLGRAYRGFNHAEGAENAELTHVFAI